MSYSLLGIVEIYRILIQVVENCKDQLENQKD